MLRKCSAANTQPSLWGATQAWRGMALLEQAIRSGGVEGQELLGQAEAVSQQALEVFPRQYQPLEWAVTQHNLGRVFAERGRWLTGEDGARALAEAVAAYQQAYGDPHTRAYAEFLGGNSDCAGDGTGGSGEAYGCRNR